MMVFLKFLLILFLLLLLFGGLSIYGLAAAVRRMFRQARKAAQDYVGPKKDESVTDRRTPEQTRKKIIPKDEGEYVEFEEEN